MQRCEKQFLINASTRSRSSLNRYINDTKKLNFGVGCCAAPWFSFVRFAFIKMEEIQLNFQVLNRFHIFDVAVCTMNFSPNDIQCLGRLEIECKLLYVRAS